VIIAIIVSTFAIKKSHARCRVEYQSYMRQVSIQVKAVSQRLIHFSLSFCAPPQRCQVPPKARRGAALQRRGALHDAQHCDRRCLLFDGCLSRGDHGQRRRPRHWRLDRPGLARCGRVFGIGLVCVVNVWQARRRRRCIAAESGTSQMMQISALTLSNIFNHYVFSTTCSKRFRFEYQGFF
jgi:hypothetical protein